ncbi:MAG: ABC transporter substrate-binding protein, partial [Candidatus Dormibacteraeota bacterium]|nr:ABC transporter substrate-binding protein [Candidatus Dormibacteraeota bacterium]
EYDTTGFEIARVASRQLVSYNASSDLTQSETLVPDIAQSLPTPTNNGLTYTFNLRTGSQAAMWNTNPPRAVTADDFIRGLKRNCDPDLAPNGNPGYYSATIMGFAAFCTPFENMPGGSATPASARAAYMDSHNIAGLVSSNNGQTLTITLTSPATDFLNIMAMPFASAQPVEMESVLPLTPPYTFFSDGPYAIQNLDPTTSDAVLKPNPAWSQAQDPIRHQYVAEIQLKADGASDTQTVQQQIDAGTADLSWDTDVPPSDVQGLINANDARFGRFPSPGITNPYLVFNVKSTSNGGALANVKVRQALEYAINRIAITKIYGGATLNLPLHQVFGPGAEGYVAFNDYPTPNDEGDPSKCKQLLQAAGVSNLVLTDYYRNSGNHPAVFQEVKTDFAACGVTVNGVTPANYYSAKNGIGTSSPTTPNTHWDLTEPGWVPDWFGPTNGRAILPDLFDGQLSYPGTDWGGYDDPVTDQLVNKALAAPTVSQASNYWHQADEQVMADAAFIPFQTQLTPLMRSSRVHNAIFLPFSASYDLSQLWVSS